VVEHWTENPRAVGSIPTLSNFFNNFDFKKLRLLGEMVDALDLKFSSFKSIGSSPVAGIQYTYGNN
jgi:hypothetical protein